MIDWRLAPTRGDVPGFPPYPHGLTAIAVDAQPAADVSPLNRPAVDARRGHSGPPAARTYLPLVDGRMFSRGQKDQVLGAVISLVVVDVMDGFTGEQGASEQIGHHGSVFENVAADIGIRVVWAPEKPVPGLRSDTPAEPPRVIRTAHLPAFGRLAATGFSRTGARAEHAADDAARLSPDFSTAGCAGVGDFHPLMIPQTYTDQNTGTALAPTWTAR